MCKKFILLIIKLTYVYGKSYLFTKIFESIRNKKQHYNKQPKGSIIKKNHKRLRSQGPDYRESKENMLIRNSFRDINKISCCGPTVIGVNSLFFSSCSSGFTPFQNH